MTAPLALLDDFGTHLDGLRMAPSTRQVRERVVLRFARWCAAHDVDLLDADTATIEAWLTDRGTGSSSTRTGYVAAIRHLYEWLAEEGRYHASNPAGPLRRWPITAQAPMAVADAAHGYRVAHGTPGPRRRHHHQAAQ